MKVRLSGVRWDLVLKAAVLVYVATFILGVALSFPLLAVLNLAHLDSQRAVQVSSLVTAIVVMVVTGYGGLRVARRVEHMALLHGFLVGLVVALLSFLLDLLFSGAITLAGLVLYALMVASGVLGGILGGRAREKS